MKTELTVDESLKREKGRIFPSDMSEKTLLAVAHSRNCIVALEKQMPKKVPDTEHYGRCPECDGEFNSELLNEYNIMFCPWCGQALDWAN